jgi:chaperonin GroES
LFRGLAFDQFSTIANNYRGRLVNAPRPEHKFQVFIQLPEIKSMKIRPLHDRVIVRRMEEERTSAGGIVIPDAAAEKPIKGEVIAVGNGKILENGEIRALDIKAGDKVLFGKYSGTEVKVDGEELLVMKEDDVMAVIEG